MRIKKISFLVMIIALISSSANAQSPFDTTMYGKNDKAGKYLKTRGFNMYYETYGSGKPLLVIHGNGGSINNFLFQIPVFAKDYKVILADSRAQGKSTDTGDSLSYEMMTDDLNALLDSLHIDSAYVIGWSDGGINGLLLAMRHPDKVKKLAITGANLSPDSSAVDPFVYRWAVGYNDSLMKIKAPTAKAKNDLKLAHLLSYEPHISPAQLATIKCPTLVIAGDHDVIRTTHSLLIAASIPNSYLWILPGSGHSTPIYFAEEFNKTVSGFFSKPFRKIEGTDRFN